MSNSLKSLFVLIVSLLILSSAEAKPNQTTKLTQALDATGINSDAYSPEISANGKYAIFRSTASNIVNGDTLGHADVFLKNIINGTISRVSVSSADQEADGYSAPAAISKSGRYILIGSDATNLVANDNNGVRDAFLIDRVANEIQRVSLANDGSESNDTNYPLDISDNGRYVLFSSADDTLSNDDNNGFRDVFLRDLELGTTALISKERPGIETDNCYSNNPAFSKNARYILFICEHTAGSNDESSIFRYDRKTGATSLVSVGADGNQSVGFADPAAISGNGRHVVFTTNDQLVPEDTDSFVGVYIRDLKNNTTKLAVTGINHTLPDDEVVFHSMTRDARYLAIVSPATNLDTLGNTASISHVYRYDRKRRKAVRASLSSLGISANADSYSAKISAAGNKIIFDSAASNLVENDSNNFSDIFMRTLKKVKPRK